MIDWSSMMRATKTRYETAGEAERFRMLCLQLTDLPYGWGEENPESVDCSGSVCYALYLMGYDIRVSADFLYREIFTKIPRDYDSLDSIMAVFYIDSQGIAKHVTPVVGKYVVLDAFGPTTVSFLRTSRSARLAQERSQRIAAWRELDHRRLEDVSLSGKYVYGLDPELSVLRRSS